MNLLLPLAVILLAQIENPSLQPNGHLTQTENASQPLAQPKTKVKTKAKTKINTKTKANTLAKAKTKAQRSGAKTQPQNSTQQPNVPLAQTENLPQTQLPQPNTPAQQTDAPLAPSETPAQQTDAQLAPSETPAQQTDAQLAQPQTSAQQTDAPLAPSETPAQQTNAQLAPSETPAQQTDAQLVQPQTLVEPPHHAASQLMVPPKPKKTVPLLGVRVDLGFPDGLGLDFLGHPLPFLQLHLGFTSNVLLGIGLRGGVTFIPWHGVFRPTFTLEAGHHWFASWVVPWFFSDTDAEVKDMLSGIQYTFVNGLVGFDVGSANVAFTFRLGGSLLFVNSNGISSQKVSDTESFYVKKIKSRVFVPTVKLGISICFL